MGKQGIVFYECVKCETEDVVLLSFNLPFTNPRCSVCNKPMVEVEEKECHSY